VETVSPDPWGYFSALGQSVSATWSRLGRQSAGLVDAAEQALTAVDVPEGLDALTFLSWAASTSQLPRQSAPNDVFGQPPLILHREQDFFVQALTWMDGTTSIHQHGFAGAFRVLQGSSLHVEHAFSPGERLADDRLLVGALSMQRAEVLRPGDTRRIEPGDVFIHALFHLEQPTITCVVRNTSSGLPHPQYSYRPPGLAWDGLWDDRTWSRRLQSLDTVNRLDPDVGRATAVDLVTHLPLWEAFSLVDHWALGHGWDATTADLTDRLADRAEALGEVLAPALEQDSRVRRILFRRGMLKARHQRVLLALLANLPDEASITAVLHDLFPGQTPDVLLIDWVEELSAPALRGVSGLSLSPDRLSALRATPVGGGAGAVLAEIRDAWGEPITVSRLFT
jgi:hypothetical protein